MLCLQATGLPGCTVTPGAFTSCWINYSSGCIAVGTGPVGSSLSYVWQDPEPPIADIQHIGLSCWDKHVSYRNVQLLPTLPPAQLQELHAGMQRRMDAQDELQQRQDQNQAEQHEPQQQEQLDHTAPLQDAAQPGSKTAGKAQQQPQYQQQLCPHVVPSLLQLVQHAIVAHLQPADVCHVLQLSEALLPRTQHLYEQAVQLAGEWFGLLVQQQLQEVAMLPLDVFMDVAHEPLLVSCCFGFLFVQCLCHLQLHSYDRMGQTWLLARQQRSRFAEHLATLCRMCRSWQSSKQWELGARLAGSQPCLVMLSEQGSSSSQSRRCCQPAPRTHQRTPQANTGASLTASSSSSSYGASRVQGMLLAAAPAALMRSWRCCSWCGLHS